MKRRFLDPEPTTESPVDSLCRALLALEGVIEMRAFLRDLCTPAELEALADRWRVVPYLLKGVAYREIHERTSVSVTTIGRVARFLSQGNGGYQAAVGHDRRAEPAPAWPAGDAWWHCLHAEQAMTPAKRRDRLRIAVQKSGRLSDASQDLLARCGLKFRQSRDRLFCFGENLAIDLLLVRDDDIPGLIAQGVCDLGIVGRNVLTEQVLASRDGRNETPACELRALGFGRCRLSIAVPQEMAYTDPQSLSGLRIATTYPALLGDWLRRNGVDAETVTLSGSVEIAPRLGTADAICDLVSSGATLAANQLVEATVILESDAVLIGTAAEPTDSRGELRELLLRRVDGVTQVRESRLVLLHAPRAAVAEISRLLPEGQQPTVLAVEGNADEVALQALCYGAITWQHLEAMKRAGACRMLVLPVEKMLI